jgi:glycosyltransferase involved in cell wall biosynthesis
MLSEMTRLGIVYDDMQKIFLADLLADWLDHFEVDIYDFTPIEFPVAKGRINPLLHRISLQSFMNRHDIVFFEWVGENLVLASHLPHKAKIIARLHSWELFHHAKWVSWHAVDRIVLVSQAMERKFRVMYPGNDVKTVVLPAGKSLTRFVPQPHEFSGKLAMMGNILPIKRVYEMLLALAVLREVDPRYTLHLAGKPDQEFNNRRYYASVLSLVEKLGLREHVSFYGWVDPAEWLPEMDIFISNSYWEGQQNALIEAMASGCYCLSHFWDGAEEILPQEYLFTTESSLVEKILAYAGLSEEEKEDRQNQMRAIAIEKCSLQGFVDRYHALLESVSP